MTHIHPTQLHIFLTILLTARPECVHLDPQVEAALPWGAAARVTTAWPIRAGRDVERLLTTVATGTPEAAGAALHQLRAAARLDAVYVVLESRMQHDSRLLVRQALCLLLAEVPFAYTEPTYLRLLLAQIAGDSSLEIRGVAAWAFWYTYLAAPAPVRLDLAPTLARWAERAAGRGPDLAPDPVLDYCEQVAQLLTEYQAAGSDPDLTTLRDAGLPPWDRPPAPAESPLPLLPERNPFHGLTNP